MTSRQYNQILRAKTSLKDDAAAASFQLGLYRTLEVQGGDRSEGVSSSESEMDEMPQDTDEGVINCEATTTTTAKNLQKDLLTRPSREERRGSSGGTEKRMTRKLRAFFTIGSKEEDLGDSSLVYSTHNRPRGDPRLKSENKGAAHQKRSTRSFQRFLQDQERYRQLKLQRQIQLIEIKHQKTAQQMLPAPKVNLKSKQLVENKLKGSCHLTNSSGVVSKENSQTNGGGGVHHRLYTERSQEKQRGIQCTEPCSDFKRSESKRTLKGHEIEALSSRLHTEAKDRQQSKERLVNSVKKDQSQRIMATKPPTSRKCPATMKYAQGRFLREFEVALCEVFQGFRDELSYDEFIQISLFLGFARTMVVDQQVINQLWMLASKGHQTANIQAVVELYLQVDRILPQPYAAFISDFDSLFANRQGRQPKTIAVEKPSFKPQLTKSTERLAQQRRQRIINTSGSSTDLLSSVCLHKTGDMLAHLLQIPSSRNEALQNSEERELVHCTFRPQILSKTKSKEGNRCLDLFQQSYHRLRSSEKQDKSTIDYEFDKQASECTFKPTLLAKPTTTKHIDSQSNCSGMFGVATTLSDDFNKLPSFGNVSFTKRGGEPPKVRPSSSRQQQPRQSSEHLKAPKLRLALPLKQPPQSHLQEEDDDEIVNITSKTPFAGDFDALLRPILYIDVNLAPGRPSERLAVFQGDTPAGLADRFSQRHELEWGMKQRLERMLEARLLEVRSLQ